MITLNTMRIHYDYHIKYFDIIYSQCRELLTLKIDIDSDILISDFEKIIETVKYRSLMLRTFPLTLVFYQR